MAWMIGVDEAGYGPRLGPLVVAATAWRCELSSCSTSDLPNADLYKQLASVVSRTHGDHRLAIADSKQLYQPGKGLARLERGVHAACHCAMGAGGNGAPPTRWTGLLEQLGADPDNRRSILPWHDGFDCPLPVDNTADKLASLAADFFAGCQSARAQPVVVAARMVFPAELNDMIDHFGTKSAALSHASLGLVKTVCQQVEPLRRHTGEPLCVVCDKHGSRNSYGGLLQHHFPEDWFVPLVESRAESRYRWANGAPPGDQQSREISFRTQGERFLPAALASMTAKYLRELAMQALNGYWCRAIPGLKPTAGYPVDANRYRREIAEMQAELGIDDRSLWRNR